MRKLYDWTVKRSGAAMAVAGKDDDSVIVKLRADLVTPAAGGGCIAFFANQTVADLRPAGEAPKAGG